MRVLILSQILILILLTGCGQVAELENDSRASTSSSESASARWPASAFPLALEISQDFESAEITTINSMADEWTSSTKTTTNYFESTSSSETMKSTLNEYNDEIMAIYKLTTWDAELPATALAVTQIFGTQKGSIINIEHADILVNYQNYEFSTDGGFGYDLATVILHEMGHFLGLYHENSVTSDESVMYPSISRFDLKRDPQAFDVSNLQSKYDFSYSALSTNRAFNILDEPAEEKPVILRLELNAEGKCTHRVNGEIIHEH